MFQISSSFTPVTPNLTSTDSVMIGGSVNNTLLDKRFFGNHPIEMKPRLTAGHKNANLHSLHLLVAGKPNRSGTTTCQPSSDGSSNHDSKCECNAKRFHPCVESSSCWMACLMTDLLMSDRKPEGCRKWRDENCIHASSSNPLPTVCSRPDCFGLEILLLLT